MTKSIDNNSAIVDILQDEKGISPGQACVFYSRDDIGERVLGGLHNSAGITPAAFNKIKSKYMIQDTKLVANKKNIKFSFNSYFPIKTVNFMRGAIIAKDDNYEKIYVEKIFDSIWRDGLNMNDNIIINKVIKNLDLNPSIFFGKVSDIKIKDKLKKLTNDALKKGIFGAPTYYVNRKIFFGQDRLSYAIDEIRK